VFFLVAIILLAASHQKTQSRENWQIIDQQVSFSSGPNLIAIAISFLASDFAIDWQNFERGKQTA